MHSERPPKHYILHIFNAFIIFYHPSFYPSTLPHRSWSHPPSFAVISSIVRDDTLAFAATRWVFVAWRAQIERKYNPQGGSISPTLLPGVASYRRQPRAIECTTPMGLPYHCPFITTTTKGCDHTTTWNYPANGREKYAERHGRGYPEGVILSRGQG